MLLHHIRYLQREHENQYNIVEDEDGLLWYGLFELDKTSGLAGKATDTQIPDRVCKNPNPEAHPQIELKRILNPIWFDCIIISIAVSIVSPVKNWMWCLSGSGTIREWQYAYGELLIITFITY